MASPKRYRDIFSRRRYRGVDKPKKVQQVILLCIKTSFLLLLLLILTLFYTRGFEIVVLHVIGSSTMQVFPLLFIIGMVI